MVFLLIIKIQKFNFKFLADRKQKISFVLFC